MSTRNLACACLVAVVLSGAQSSGQANDWPQFRGPNRDGVSLEKGLLQKWPDAGPPKVWTAAGLGGGEGSIAVAQGAIYGIGNRGAKRVLWALDEATGKPKWSALISDERNVKEGGMNSTPTFAKGRVYAVSGMGDLVCADAATGNIVWRKSYLDDFGGKPPGFGGYSESVLVDDGKVICAPGSASAAIVALKAETGEVIWKTKTEINSRQVGWLYASAVKAEVGGVPLYITILSGAQGGLTAVHAKTGSLLWQYNKMMGGAYPIPNPLVKGDLVVASTDGGWAVLQMTAAGKDEVAVKELKRYGGKELGDYRGGMVPVGDCIYFAHTLAKGGYLPVCVDWAGQIKWKASEAPGGGEGSAGVIYADGMLYLQYENGVIALVKADPDQFTLVSTFAPPEIRGRDKRSHPAIANGRLYIHDHDRLHCFNLKAGAN